MVFIPFPTSPVIHVPGTKGVTQIGSIPQLDTDAPSLNMASMAFSIVFAVLALGIALWNTFLLQNLPTRTHKLTTVLTLLTSVVLLVNFGLEAVIVSPSNMTISASFLSMLYWTFTLADIMLTSTLLLVMNQRMYLVQRSTNKGLSAVLLSWKWIVESVLVGSWTAIMITGTVGVAEVNTTSNFGHAVMNTTALIHTALAIYLALAIDLSLTSLYMWWKMRKDHATDTISALALLLLVRAGFFGIYHIAYFINFKHDNFAALHLVFTLITPSINLIIIGGLLACIVSKPSIPMDTSIPKVDDIKPPQGNKRETSISLTSKVQESVVSSV